MLLVQQRELHQRALQISRQYLKLEGDLLLVLEKILAKKVYLQEGYSSLFEYMVKGLSLSESTAYSLQTVIRKAKDVPVLRLKVVLGELSLAKAKRIAPVVTTENAAQWITLAQTATTREIDQQVAQMCPQVTRERLAVKAENRYELRVGLSTEAHNKLKRCQDLVSRQQRQSVSIEFTLEAALDALLGRLGSEKEQDTPAAKRGSSQNLVRAGGIELPGCPFSAEKSLRQNESSSQIANEKGKDGTVTEGGGAIKSGPEFESAKEIEIGGVNRCDVEIESSLAIKRNKALTPKTKHIVLKRDKFRCAHVNSRGERCSNSRFLEVHHVRARVHGGRYYYGQRSECATAGR